jgi:HemY protein
MMRFFFFLIVLVIAVWLGVHIKTDPGYMLLAYEHWTIEMSLWLGLILIMITFLLLYWLIKLLACFCGIPDRVRFWSGRRRARIAHEKTNRGLIALAEGNWIAAEKHLLHAAATADTPLINYLAAARAAQARGAYDRRDNYLRQAHTSNPDAGIAVGLTQAQLQLDHRQLEQALATLRHLRELAPHHKYVLKLLQQLYFELNDWQSLQELLPQLRKYNVLTTDELEQLTLTVYQHRLETAIKEQQDVTKLWQALPRYLHYKPALIATYVPYLMRQGENDAAEALLREVLKKNWHEKLLLLYSELKDIDHKKQLAHAEAWLKQHKNDAILLYVLGKISLANQLWGKAHGYFEASINNKPSIAAYHDLAYLLEKDGDTMAAMACYHKAAKLVDAK